VPPKWRGFTTSNIMGKKGGSEGLKGECGEVFKKGGDARRPEGAANLEERGDGEEGLMGIKEGGLEKSIKKRAGCCWGVGSRHGSLKRREG